MGNLCKGKPKAPVESDLGKSTDSKIGDANPTMKSSLRKSGYKGALVGTAPKLKVKEIKDI